MRSPFRATLGTWSPVAGVEAELRAEVDARFLQLAALRDRGGGESGVFARVAIPKGTVLVHRWHDEYYVGMPGWELLPLEVINTLPDDVHQLFRRYGLDHDFGLIYGPVSPQHVSTLDNFINHACEPNLGYDHRGNLVAAVDLAAGAELLLDYGGFVVNYDEPFACRCGAPACRGRVTHQDWRALPAERLPPFVRSRRAHR